jgi:glycerol-3-phosphate dehydrogenase (NAD(P)+)
MKQMKRIAVFGGGVMGRAVGRVLALNGAEVRLWARRAEARAALQEELSHAVICETIEETCKDAGLIFFAVPASAITEVAATYGKYAQGDHTVIHAARGIGEGFVLPHQMIRRETCAKRIGVIGGPLHIQDIAAGRPLAMVVASRFDESAEVVKQLVQGTPVRVHPSRDIVGVEIAGAISNVSALAVGMCEELQLGDTARGILLTHGLSEAAKLGAAFGALPATFAGLAGVGDLIPRRVTSTNRHHEVGRRLAEGQSLEAALQGLPGVVEGVITAKEASREGKRRNIQLPLVSAMASIIEGTAKPKDALESVLQVDLDLGRWLSAR